MDLSDRWPLPDSPGVRDELAAAAVGLMPGWTRLPLRLPWLPVSERTAFRALGTAATSTIRWAMSEPRAERARAENQRGG